MLPKRANAGAVLLEVYSRGSLRRQIKFNELFPTEKAMQHAREAGAWGKALGSPESAVAEYLLSSGRKLTVSLPSATFATE